jgi:hypothetical protein
MFLIWIEHVINNYFPYLDNARDITEDFPITSKPVEKKKKKKKEKPNNTNFGSNLQTLLKIVSLANRNVTSVIFKNMFANVNKKLSTLKVKQVKFKFNNKLIVIMIIIICL